ncbi:MAG: hypothetical protein JO134_02460 [Xanthobacteraceae bacterium]|nr:hypothetical protein [Xanthobacteraceae bacterium]
MISLHGRERHGLCLGHWLGIAAIITVLLGEPPCFAAESITLRDVTFQIGQTSYRAPRIEFVGANLNEQQLSELFDARASAPLDKRLAELSAAAVNVPELVAEWSSPSGRQSVTLRDLAVQNVVNGKAASASTRAAHSEGSYVAMLSIGPIAMTDLDLALAARLYQHPSAIKEKDPDAVVGAVDLNALDLRSQGGSMVHADRVSLSGVRALPSADKDADAKSEPDDAQRYLSGVGTVSFVGVGADIASDQVGNERLKFSMKNATLATEHPYNGLPTDIALSIDDFRFIIPSPSQAQTARDLHDMGYDAAELSLQMSASWNEATSEVVSDISLRAADAGNLALRARLGNVSKEAFSSTPAVAEAASSKATVKSLVVTVKDAGLFDRVLANEAHKENRATEDVRRDFLFESGAAIASVLGTTPAAGVVTRAVTDFIKRPSELEISLKAKPPDGIGWTDLSAAKLPADLSDKLTISARAR